MVPSSTWFPSSLAARAAWFANFAAQFLNYSAILGLSAFDGQVTNDNTDFQSIAETRLAAKNFDKAIADFLRELTEWPVGSPLPVFPVEAFAAPPRGVAAGIFQRLDELRTLIMAQATYTDAMGTAMGIIPASPVKPIPSTVKPDVQAFAAANNNHFSLVVTGRGEAVMWDVYIKRKGGSWIKHETCSGKSADIIVSLQSPGDAEQIEVYVQLRKNNADYGQPSDPVYVTLNP